MTDFELLRSYAEKGDEGVFAELMGRHVDWVYSACRRQVRDGRLSTKGECVVEMEKELKAAMEGNP